MRTRNRNPVRHFGRDLAEGYVAVPNNFARARLDPGARGLAVEILSHTDGFGVSVAGMARNSGRSRDYVQDRIDELVAARWLVLREYRMPNGNHAFFEYCIRSDRPFTTEEIAELSQPVNLPEKASNAPDANPDPLTLAEDVRPAGAHTDTIAVPSVSGSEWTIAEEAETAGPIITVPTCVACNENIFGTPQPGHAGEVYHAKCLGKRIYESGRHAPQPIESVSF